MTSGGIKLGLIERDEQAIAKGQKLRFSPTVTASGAGVYHFEEDGRRLIDFSSCWGAIGLGNAHPTVVAAVITAISEGSGGTILSAINPQAVQLAEALIRITPGKFEKRVLFGHAGTDANEAAIQMANGE